MPSFSAQAVFFRALARDAAARPPDFGIMSEQIFPVRAKFSIPFYPASFRPFL